MPELPLPSQGHSDPGLVHERNEDQFAVFDTPDGGRVLVVCDGMGGMGRGDEASRVAVDALRDALLASDQGSPADRMADAVRAADDRVREELCRPHDASQPGSTAVLIYVRDGSAWVCWVGDSRAYLIREGEVFGRTRDHKLVEDLVEAGQMTPADARNSSLAHVVTRALGGKAPAEPGVTPATLPRPWRLRTGDHLLVCSDGLTDLVEDHELPPLVEVDGLDAVPQALIDLANERGGHDNITCITARWDGPDWDGQEVDEDATEVGEPPPVNRHGAPALAARDALQPVDVSALARELMPWWIATAALLLCALVAGLAAALGS